jgi:hypothetical protein
MKPVMNGTWAKWKPVFSGKIFLSKQSGILMINTENSYIEWNLLVVWGWGWRGRGKPLTVLLHAGFTVQNLLPYQIIGCVGSL